MTPLSPAEREQRQAAALKHGASSSTQIARVAANQKRRILRQCGLRANDLGGIGRALLDNYARAQSKVVLIDAHIAERGSMFEEGGEPVPAMKLYISCVNSARLALAKLSEHLIAAGAEPSMVALLQGQARRVG